MPLFENMFYEVAGLLLLAAIIGGLATGFRQPLIVAFIAVGILSGPAGLNWMHSADQVDLLAKIGITLLLFVVGLKLDVHLIRRMVAWRWPPDWDRWCSPPSSDMSWHWG